MVKFLQQNLIKRQRGRACIVLTHEYAQQKEWAAELARLTDSAHIDLMELFSSDDGLACRISAFTVQELFSLFAKQTTEKKVLIVTGIEFLRATWADKASDREEFASRVERWQTNPALLIVTQYEKFLAERNFTRFPEQIFIIDQKETYTLS